MGHEQEDAQLFAEWGVGVLLVALCPQRFETSMLELTGTVESFGRHCDETPLAPG